MFENVSNLTSKTWEMKKKWEENGAHENLTLVHM